MEVSLKSDLLLFVRSVAITQLRELHTEYDLRSQHVGKEMVCLGCFWKNSASSGSSLYIAGIVANFVADSFLLLL